VQHLSGKRLTAISGEITAAPPRRAVDETLREALRLRAK
jgi:hypothetical protein